MGSFIWLTCYNNYTYGSWFLVVSHLTSLMCVCAFYKENITYEMCEWVHASMNAWHKNVVSVQVKVWWDIFVDALFSMDLLCVCVQKNLFKNPHSQSSSWVQPGEMSCPFNSLLLLLLMIMRKVIYLPRRVVVTIRLLHACINKFQNWSVLCV